MQRNGLYNVYVTWIAAKVVSADTYCHEALDADARSTIEGEFDSGPGPPTRWLAA